MWQNSPYDDAGNPSGTRVFWELYWGPPILGNYPLHQKVACYPLKYQVGLGCTPGACFQKNLNIPPSLTGA